MVSIHLLLKAEMTTGAPRISSTTVQGGSELGRGGKRSPERVGMRMQASRKEGKAAEMAEGSIKRRNSSHVIPVSDTPAFLLFQQGPDALRLSLCPALSPPGKDLKIMMSTAQPVAQVIWLP